MKKNAVLIQIGELAQQTKTSIDTIRYYEKETLCPACGACPEIAIYGEEVHIGEENNLVKLKKSEWNELVKKIKTGELKEV